MNSSQTPDSSEAVGPAVFVCVLNWNSIKNTLACLDAVFAQDYTDIYVIVVDNGSTDGSVETLRGLGDRVAFIENKENLGFTGGCNVGIRYALSRGADYVWLLNNDSECEPNTLSQLVAYGEARHEVGMLSPIIVNRQTGKHAFALRRLDLQTGLDEHALEPDDIRNLQETHPDQIMIRGTALLLKRTLIQAIGYFDDAMFAYCEDDDYCVRCAKAGFRAACVTTARVYHDEGHPGSGWRKPYAYYYAVRNGIRFWRKHSTGVTSWKRARWQVCIMFRVLARTGYGKAETKALADGLWSGLRGGVGRWDPTQPGHRMPALLRVLFTLNPALMLACMEADPGAALRALSPRRGG